MKNLILIILLGALILFGASSMTLRYQISAAEKMYCWVLDTATGKVTIMNLRDGRLQILDSIKVDTR